MDYDVYLSDEGLCSENGRGVTSKEALLAGRCIAAVAKKVVIAHNGEKSAQCLSLSAAAGASERGADVFFASALPEPAFDLAMKLIGAKAGCFVSGGVFSKIKFFSERGLPLSLEDEQKIEKVLSGKETKILSGYGKIRSIDGVSSVYSERIRNLLGDIKTNVKIYSPDREVMAAAERIFPRCRGDGDIVFNISSDGRKVSAFSLATGHIFYEKLLLLCSVAEFKEGNDISLPFSSPFIIDEIASGYGKKVTRYYERTKDFSDSDGRKNALYCRFGRDALTLIAKILRYLEDNDLTLYEATETLPSFATVTRFVPKENAEEVFEKICSRKAGKNEGVAKCENGERVIIKPVKSGRGFTLIAESFRTETASELCDFYEKKIKTL